MEKKMVRAVLTKDPEINRKALPKDMLDTIAKFKEAFGGIKLTGYWVEQGSEHAQRVTDAHLEYARTHPDAKE